MDVILQIKEYFNKLEEISKNKKLEAVEKLKKEKREEKYNELKNAAMRLGSAFQKVNFLRDLKDDFELLNRSYFPNVDLGKLNAISKQLIIDEIEADFDYAYKNGVLKFPIEAKFAKPQSM